MNLQNLKSVFLGLSVVGLCASVWSLALHKFFDVSQAEELALFFFLLGASAASSLHHYVIERSYVVQAFRLNGWGDNEHAVLLRVYENRITAHDDHRIIHATENIPAAPRWIPVKGTRNAVVVCDQLYQLDA